MRYRKVYRILQVLEVITLRNIKFREEPFVEYYMTYGLKQSSTKNIHKNKFKKEARKSGCGKTVIAAKN